MKQIIFVLSIAMAVLSLYLSLTLAFEAYLQRTIFLGFTLVLIFLTKPAIKGRPRLSFWALDLPLAMLAAIPVIYASYEHFDLILRIGESTQYDFAMGLTLFLLVLEATRRAVGWPLVILALILITYCFFGRHFPSFLAHGGYSLLELIEINYMSLQGILGVMIGVVADFVIIFIIFGAFLEKCGAIKKFSDLSQSLMGWQIGGPAKGAVVASGLMGSLSGSSAANVVTTGSFTIPLMKKVGYSATFAGAVEAAASTGGQIMPPIMGASAFVIMGILGMSYLGVCKAALLPSVFYFFSVWVCIHYTSKKMGFKGLPKKDLPPIFSSFLKAGLMIIPAALILVVLVIGYSPNLAGFYAVASVIVISFVQRETRLNLRSIFSALSDGSLKVLNISIVCATAGIIVSSFLITGLGMRISTIVGSVATYNVYIALILAAIASIILGMGMPTVGAYIIVAVLSAPALIDLGFSPIATHMFVFYFAILCNVTPPVALAAYAAAPIAGGDTDPWKLGLKAFSFTFASFVIPFVFITNKALLLDAPIYQILYAVLAISIGILSLNIAIIGYSFKTCSALERFLYLLASCFLFMNNLLTDIVGFCMVAFLYILERREVIFSKKLSFFKKSETKNN